MSVLDRLQKRNPELGKEIIDNTKLAPLCDILATVKPQDWKKDLELIEQSLMGLPRFFFLKHKSNISDAMKPDWGPTLIYHNLVPTSLAQFGKSILDVRAVLELEGSKEWGCLDLSRGNLCPEDLSGVADLALLVTHVTVLDLSFNRLAAFGTTPHLLIEGLEKMNVWRGKVDFILLFGNAIWSFPEAKLPPFIIAEEEDVNKLEGPSWEHHMCFYKRLIEQ